MTIKGYRKGIAAREYTPGAIPEKDSEARDWIMIMRQNAESLLPPHQRRPLTDWRPANSETGRLLQRAIESLDVDHEPDAEGLHDYALRVRAECDVVLSHIERGDVEAAVKAAFHLGELHSELVIKCGWEPHALRGDRIAKSGAKGGQIKAKAHGWKHRAAKLQAAVDQKHNEKPNLSYERICERVAAEFGCGKSTVKKHTRNPTT